MLELVVSCLVTVGGSVLVALAGMLLVRRRVSYAVLREHNDVSGFLLAVVGVVYAVLLVFVVVVVWERFDAADGTVQREAGALSNIYRLAQGFTEPAGQQALKLTHDYAHEVIENEWPLMAEGRQSNRAWDIVDHLWQATRQITPKGSREQSLYDQMLAQMAEFTTQRKLRLLASQEGIHPIMWLAIWGGAVITVTFTYFFGVENVRVQAWLTGLTVGILALNIFVIKEIDYPFQGYVHVKPDAFALSLEQIERQARGAARRTAAGSRLKR